MQRDHFAIVSNAFDSLRRILGFALRVAIVLCLAYVAIEFAPRRGHVEGFAQLQRYGDVLTTQVAAVFHAPSIKRYVPVALALAAYLLILVFNRLFALVDREIWARAPLPPLRL